MRLLLLLLAVLLAGCGDSYRYERTKIADFMACDTSFTLYDEVITFRDGYYRKDRVVWRDTTIDRDYYVTISESSKDSSVLADEDTVFVRWVIWSAHESGKIYGGLLDAQVDSIVREDWFHESVSIIR